MAARHRQSLGRAITESQRAREDIRRVRAAVGQALEQIRADEQQADEQQKGGGR